MLYGGFQFGDHRLPGLGWWFEAEPASQSAGHWDAAPPSSLLLPCLTLPGLPYPALQIIFTVSDLVGYQLDLSLNVIKSAEALGELLLMAQHRHQQA